MQKFSPISDDFKVGRRISPERIKYSKSDKYLIDSVKWKKSGELWSSSQGNLKVKLYPPKTLFWILEDQRHLL